LAILFYAVEPKQKKPQVMNIGNGLVVQEYFRGVMVLDQLEQVKKILDLGGIETGVGLVKIPFALLHEIFVFFRQFQGFGKIF